MTAPRLAIAIPTFNRAAMLDATMRELVPLCERLGVPILVGDNASTDATPEVCARWAAAWSGFRFVRREVGMAPAANLMDVMARSEAEYTWFLGDDDYVVPEGMLAVLRCLEQRRPSALVVRTIAVPSEQDVDLAAPIAPQVAPLVVGDVAGFVANEYVDATDFFAAKFYDLSAPSIVYRTEATLATDYARYVDTYHPHLGALYDALAVEQAERGRVDVVELPDLVSISLTVHHDRGKTNWTSLFDFFALEAFPRWLEELPPLYAPHLPAAWAFHRHVFRAALVPPEGDAAPDR